MLPPAGNVSLLIAGILILSGACTRAAPYCTKHIILVGCGYSPSAIGNGFGAAQAVAQQVALGACAAGLADQTYCEMRVSKIDSASATRGTAYPLSDFGSYFLALSIFAIARLAWLRTHGSGWAKKRSR